MVSTYPPDHLRCGQLFRQFFYAFPNNSTSDVSRHALPDGKNGSASGESLAATLSRCVVSLEISRAWRKVVRNIARMKWRFLILDRFNGVIEVIDGG